MHFVLFLGIFGLPVVACVGMLIARALDSFLPEAPPARGRTVADRADETESRVNDLVDRFISAPVEQTPQP